MATIITKNSQTASAVPSAASLEVGELAVNTADGKLYTKHSDSTIKALSPTLNELLPSQTGNSGKVLGTNGSTTSWVSSAPESLAKTFPLKTGASLAAGRFVNINSSGEVGDYPVSNSLGSVVTNTGGYSYFQFSTDGSRALHLTATEGSYNNGIYTLTIRGMAVTGSGFTNGTTTVTSALNYRGNINQGFYLSHGYNAVPINETQFLLFFWAYGAGYNNDETSTTKRRSVAFVVTVDANGNCTKGNETTIFNRDSPVNQQEGGFGGSVYRFVNNLFGCQVYGGTTAGTLGYYLSISGTTVTSAQDNDFYFMTGSTQAGGSFGQVTSGNIAVNTGVQNDNTLYKATWNGSALGTVTSETIMSGASRIIARMVSPTILLAAYTDGANVLRIATFTINQSTGAATLYASRVLDSTLAVGAIRLSIAAESSTKFLLTCFNAGNQYGYSFEINSSGDIIGTGIRLLIGLTDEDLNPTYTGSLSTYRIANYGNKTQNFVVNSYNTPQWNSLGVSATAQTTSPATIVTDGVVGGFTGLTPGSTYYIDQSAYNGSITTTPGNFLAGLAISSTQISLGI